MALYRDPNTQPALGIQVLSRAGIGGTRCIDFCSYGIWLNFYLLEIKLGV